MVTFSAGYVDINKKAFDKLAPEYNKRSTKNIRNQESFLALFEKRLMDEFENPISILDAGCGVGIDSLILSIHGFKVDGIDISSKMLSYAKQNAPFANFEQVDFLDKNGAKYNGVLMHAFIHLFPRRDITKVLRKTRSFLVPKGIVLVSTTSSKQSKEGFYEKEDYGIKTKRFRRFWTKDELILTFESEGFKLIDYFLDYQTEWNKEWMNFIFQKKDTNP